MNYKKIISLILAISLASISGLTYAWDYNKTSSWYKEVIQTDDFELEADLESDWTVELKWNKIWSFDNFKYYKLVRSNTNPNPKYPEDWYIKYSPNSDFTEYTDKSPKKWVNYYRICKIMKDNNRYCSETQKIYIEAENNNASTWIAWTSEYKIPKLTDDFWLVVIKKDNEVVLEWKEIDHDNDFMWYKIIRSKNNPNPYYPENWAIWVYEDDDKTRYVDYKPFSGKNYYRVCLITKEKDRYCSPVEAIYFNKTTDKKANYNKPTTYYKPNYGLNNEMKEKLNAMIKPFFEKLEAKDISNDDKIETLEKVSKALVQLGNKKRSLKASVNYLNMLIKKQIMQYESSWWMSDIEKIFNENL